MNMQDIQHIVATGLPADQIDTWNNPLKRTIGIALTADDGCAMYIVLSHADAARIGWDLVHASGGVEANGVTTTDSARAATRANQPAAARGTSRTPDTHAPASQSPARPVTT
jgi:hypothetical protein